MTVKLYPSAREFARAISRGDLPGGFNGQATYEVIKQQLTQLKMNYEPEKWLGNGGKYIDPKLDKWQKKMAIVTDSIRSLPESDQVRLRKEVDDFFTEQSEIIEKTNAILEKLDQD